MKEFKQNDKIELKVGGSITIKRKIGSVIIKAIFGKK